MPSITPSIDLFHHNLMKRIRMNGWGRKPMQPPKPPPPPPRIQPPRVSANILRRDKPPKFNTGTFGGVTTQQLVNNLTDAVSAGDQKFAPPGASGWQMFQRMNRPVIRSQRLSPTALSARSNLSRMV